MTPEIKALLGRCALFTKSVRAVDKNDGRETSQSDQLIADIDAALAEPEKTVTVRVWDVPVIVDNKLEIEKAVMLIRDDIVFWSPHVPKKIAEALADSLVGAVIVRGK